MTLHWVAIGVMVLVCSCASGKSLRKRRQLDFVFPDEFESISNRGGFQNQFRNQFQNQFQNDFSNQQVRPPQSNARVPFPTPIQPGPPAFIDETQQESVNVMPDAVLTTPSPSLLACMRSCPTTSEYNPICGTNRQLYFNQQRFDCALRCGSPVRIWRRGSCAGLFNMMRG